MKQRKEPAAPTHGGRDLATWLADLASGRRELQIVACSAIEEIDAWFIRDSVVHGGNARQRFALELEAACRTLEATGISVSELGFHAFELHAEKDAEAAGACALRCAPDGPAPAFSLRVRWPRRDVRRDALVRVA